MTKILIERCLNKKDILVQKVIFFNRLQNFVDTLSKIFLSEGKKYNDIVGEILSYENYEY